MGSGWRMEIENAILHATNGILCRLPKRQLRSATSFHGCYLWLKTLSKRKKQNHQAHFPLVWQAFMRHFHSSMSSFLSFFRLKKAAALRQEPMKSHTPSQSIQAMLPEKVCLKKQLESGPSLLQYLLSLENPPHVKLSSNAKEMLQRPLWKNYPLSR